MISIHPETTRLGWIGTGVMGRSMCTHLLKAGYSLSVYNRTPEKSDSLVQMGARRCESPLQVAQNSDVVFSMVGYPSDVEEVLLGESGALRGLRSGGILVDMTTSRPALAEAVYDKAKQMGCHALDAPVSGGDIGAKEARLSIMVGGDRDVFDALVPLWKSMGKTYVYQGPAGSGQHTKMVNQILIASSMVGLCEALLYATRSGLDPQTVLESVSSGAAGSWSLSNLTPRILREDYSPGFFVDHFVKDLGIVLDEAARMQLQLPGVELAIDLYRKLQGMGHGSSGTQALWLAVSR
ncbi:2-hydroxy-3-oxopropionate reductase [Pirellula sp. SH-Sr6A]|uniref:NAD(P)-dependent oxidoreductase n=1 Tax=Pirellula sp. SH-Sr6A TaxID=1632865 RepID=UPI00078BC674|nr:NAD(P)-dependent oxidoreductase [Pirellula sp. SH-Sr6A]AMV33015.1 2-hydroxy-3-oxopropionate reductase [Pirellula sp. SH-Sr6A]